MEKFAGTVGQKVWRKSEQIQIPRLRSDSLDDLGGVVTDSWDLQDRLVVLTVRSFENHGLLHRADDRVFLLYLLIQPK